MAFAVALDGVVTLFILRPCSFSAAALVKLPAFPSPCFPSLNTQWKKNKLQAACSAHSKTNVIY